MQRESLRDWSPSGRICFRFFAVFVLLILLSFPFDYTFLPSPAEWFRRPAVWLAQWTAAHLPGIDRSAVMQLFSDTTGLYVHVLNMAVLAVLIAIGWSVTDRRKAYPLLLYAITTLIRYYLALQLLLYGIGKVCNNQFYLPEPNTIYTPLANVPRDLLYWTTMSLSRPYTIAMGVAEILAAVLLLFRRTHLGGALLATGILTHVFLINLGYDISVKLHSGLLLLFAISLLVPHRQRLWQVFTLQALPSGTDEQPIYSGRWRWWRGITKLTIVALLLTETLLPYIRSGQYNDDTAPRPFLHGAYMVTDFVRNGDTIPPLLSDTQRWKRFFIHRRYYAIIQGMGDDMTDFALAYDTAHHSLLLTSERDTTQLVLQYELPDDSTLFLHTVLNGDSIDLQCKKLDWRRTPLMQRPFGWTID